MDDRGGERRGGERRGGEKRERERRGGIGKEGRERKTPTKSLATALH